MVSASVKDVAALAGVSVGTVSTVLNRPEKVSAEVTSRVQAGQDLDQAGLARAVLADQRVDFAGPEFDGAVGPRNHRTEGLGRVGKGKYRHRSVR